MKKLLAILILALNLTTIPVASAVSFDFRDTFSDFQEGVEEQSGTLEDGTEAIVLPTYQEDQVTKNTGVEGIVNTVQNLLDLFKLLVTPLAILFIVIMGVRMIVAGSNNEEVMTQSKNFIRYAVEGLIMIFVADAVVNVFFGAEGEIFRAGESGAQEFGRKTAELFRGVYSLVQVLISFIAVFVLITAGMRYIGGSYSDDQIASAKKQITWALVGLFVIAISEFVVKDIIFRDAGTSFGLDSANQLFAQVTNFAAGTIGTLSFAFMLYAGYLYVTARENEEAVAKAKKIILGALLGILLAAAAFALTSTIIDLDMSR